MIYYKGSIFATILLSVIFSAINHLNELGDVSISDNQNYHIEVLELPTDINYTSDGYDRRFKFGHKFDVDYDMNTSGTWETMETGKIIWRLGILSSGAYSLQVQLNELYLPEGSELIIYNGSEDMVYGPYVHEDIKYETLSSPLIKGDLLILEYHQFSNIKDEPRLIVSSVIHDYTDIFDFYGTTQNRDCGENVVCEDAEEFRDQANSVIYMVINQYTCSATLINNVNNDNTPFVLTAWHCIVGETTLGEHNDFIYYFNHESPTCEGNNGSFAYSVSGSTLLAMRNENVGSDFALFVMDESPPAEWNPFYAGWTNDEIAPNISSGIHHPEDDPRKINYDNDDAWSCAWNTPNTHWCVEWDDGGTTNGSSGSAIFDINKRLVGSNTGSDGPNCSPGPDLYGKFSVSWDGGNNQNRRLKDWLDPDDTGVIAIDGIYTNSDSLLGDINLDGTLDVIDVVLLVQIILGYSEETDNSDMNSDGHINVQDIILLVNIILVN